MGRPVSAVVAKLYTKHFEKLAVESTPLAPRLWKRYVDDRWCIFRSGAIEKFH